MSRRRWWSALAGWLALFGLSRRGAGASAATAATDSGLPLIRVPPGFRIVHGQAHWYMPSRGTGVTTWGADAAGNLICVKQLRHNGSIATTVYRGPQCFPKLL
jgi:hypothetical protein